MRSVSIPKAQKRSGLGLEEEAEAGRSLHITYQVV
jgi:hypothetical protein